MDTLHSCFSSLVAAISYLSFVFGSVFSYFTYFSNDPVCFQGRRLLRDVGKRTVQKFLMDSHPCSASLPSLVFSLFNLGNFLANKLIWTHWWSGTHGWLVCCSQHSVHRCGERSLILLIFNENARLVLLVPGFSRNAVLGFQARNGASSRTIRPSPRTKLLKMTS